MDLGTTRGTAVPPPPAGPAAYAMSRQWLLDATGVDPSTGLTSAEAADARQFHGANSIGQADQTPWWRTLAKQFEGAVIWLLLGAAALSAWVGDQIEMAAILAVLLVNAAIGFVTERRAETSMAALRRMTITTARVRRDGRVQELRSDLVVPGDVVLLEAGDVVPADLRLLEVHDLHADESALTGESVPVAKRTDPLAEDAALGDRANLAFKGTSITRGRGTGLVIGIGRATQIGEIAELVARQPQEKTPLEQRLDKLGRQLAVAALGVTIMIVAIGLAVGRPFLAMVETGIALAVAAVPEGLPIVATLALARGMWRMAERNVLVNRLPAVETLGSVNVLMTDKTGTLTENRMAVDRVLLPDEVIDLGAVVAGPAANPALARAVETMVLCNDASLERPDHAATGDPMELALLRAAEALGCHVAALRAAHPRTAERPFDPELKIMATVHDEAEGRFAAVKGAPEAVLARTTRVAGPDGPEPLTEETRAHLVDRAERAAGAGLRLLGLARRAMDPGDDPLEDLDFLGFVALADPPRADVADAMAAFHRAGVRVVMVTGDHASTARNIAAAVGLVPAADARVCTADKLAAAVADPAKAADVRACDVFARIPPHGKLDLAAMHREAGAIVAMTGDGVNDAPALQRADIGVAMGQRGTQVACEAADIILRDDRFASIVHAIHEGRVIYSNIRTFIRYLFACNLSEIVVLTAATASGLPMPLLPLQILFLNLVTDVFPALALGAGEGRKGIMEEPPRPSTERLLGPHGWLGVMVDSLAISVPVMGVYLFALATAGATEANAAAFLALAMAQLWYVFALFGRGETLIASAIARNRLVWGAVALSLGLIALAIFFPPLANILALAPPSPGTLIAVLIASLLPMLIASGLRVLRHRRSVPDGV